MKKISEFHFRTNYEYFSLPRGGHLILYEDHRCLLNVLFEARRLLGLTAPNLVYFDYHDDAAGGWTLNRALAAMGRDSFDEVTSRDFWPFVEFDLGGQDNDWLVAGMELGLIGDAVVVGAEGLRNYEVMDRPFIDSSGRIHQYFSIQHPDFSLSPVGALGNPEPDDTHRRIQDLFGYSPGGGFREHSPYALDFDLGCFAADFVEKTIAWPERLFNEKYIAGNPLVQPFIRRMVDEAAVVTVCRESGCCGGIGEANKILSYLDRHFFGSALRALPYY